MINFHSITIKACFKELSSSPLGLTRKEALKRLKKHGFNRLREKKKIGKIVIFFSQFRNPLIYILLVAGLFSFFLGEHIDAGVIFGAVILNTIIGFFQENKANNALNKLKQMIEQKAFVIRDGVEIEIDSSEVVVGDIIVIEAGNKIPADARLIESAGVKMNEANLTGESFPLTKSIEKINKGAALADRKNMVYASTLVAVGRARGVVVATGMNTEIGKISELVGSTREEKTPLQAKLASFSRFLGILFVSICTLVLIMGLIQGRSFLEIFLVSVSLAVAAIPEGLIVSVTFILVLGMQQILKEKALIRKLIATETLGSTTVICSDKTGTLTEGKMSVSNIIIGTKEFEMKTLGARKGKEAEIVSLALQTAMMCNNAVVENPEDSFSKQRFIGTPTDVALYSVATQSGLSREKLLNIEPKIDEIPFSSDIKFMVTLHRWRKNNLVLYEKGAPEIVMDKCSKFYHLGKCVKLSINHRVKLDETYNNLTKKGLRVIGVATKEIKNKKWEQGDDWKEIDNDLTFIGFIALKDPLRSDAKMTVEEAKKAGIRPVIITGDHRLTAMAVAEEIGFDVSANFVVNGSDLDKMDDETLKKKVNEIDIYARVSPHHKLRIVKALQARGEVVAMTGDGINDAPALKAADIGISLGTGTDIAKETADMVLLDDRFSVILSAIKQGRIIFSNIRKVITYLISDSFTEIILVTGSIFLGIPLAILPAQILWINIVNDGLPDFSLAFEKGDKNIMRRKPISRKEPIINREMKFIIFGVGIVRDFLILALFVKMFKDGGEIEYLRTLFFVMIGFKSLVGIFSLRSLNRMIWEVNPFNNLYLIGAVGISSLLLLSAVYLPIFQKMLHTCILSPASWKMVFVVAFLSLIITEMVKFYFIKIENKK